MKNTCNVQRLCSEAKGGLEPGRNGDAKATQGFLRTTKADAPLLAMFILALMGVQSSQCHAQVVVQPQSQTKVAVLRAPGQGASEGDSDLKLTASEVSMQQADPSHSGMSPVVAKELEAMKARIEQLESELKQHEAPEQSAAGTVVPAKATVSAAAQPQAESTAASPAAAPEKPAPSEPFAYADWTWLNGTPRNKDTVWDSKFFTPEVRFDTDFVHSFNHPHDDTLGGSTEIFRSDEIQVEQISVGGDFHWNNVRGRILTMDGMFATTTPRNDGSTGRGQWDLRDAYRYVSEAYGGYHFNVNHGLNVDAGIFVSYIGLFSYYNFDNWAYQPSYVSSNTPWFFNGIRVQWFPTDKLKIEPWIINGWQSYARYGSKPGLGGQILWRPKSWISMVFNNYGMGEDTLGTGDGHSGRSRIHTDDSLEIKYYDKPGRTLDKMAFSLTGDLGCEYGNGNGGEGVAATNCYHNKPGANGTSYKQTFAGWMLYNRWWFKKDVYGVTLGGGVMDNPGRYLVLLPPINGADAISGSPYFTQNSGDLYKAWDSSLTFNWMPQEYITFCAEYGYRHASVPYFSGSGGITPPGGNTGTPSVAVPGWAPDLRKDEGSIRLAMMVKF
jgi:hypothetical protein